MNDIVERLRELPVILRSRDMYAEADSVEDAIAEIQRLRGVAEAVVWFDWSENDEDAVEAIEKLRAALLSTQPVAAKEDKPAPNWCPTCDKRPDDPMSIFCSDGFHKRTPLSVPAAVGVTEDMVRRFLEAEYSAIHPGRPIHEPSEWEIQIAAIALTAALTKPGAGAV